jgi:hypothetical protein
MPSLSTQNKVAVRVVNPVNPLIDIDWDKADGGARSHNVTKVRARAGGPKLVLTGDSEVENITTEAFIDPVAHAQLLQQLHAGETFSGSTITRQFLDANGVPIPGTKLEHKGCAVVKSESIPADANSDGEGAKLVVEWQVGD